MKYMPETLDNPQRSTLPLRKKKTKHVSFLAGVELSME